MLGGCQETPDSVIVKPKGKEAIENYEEDKSREDSSEKQQGLREKLGIPETFQDKVVLEDGKVTLTTDAVIELPDAQSFSDNRGERCTAYPGVYGQDHPGPFSGEKMY